MELLFYFFAIIILLIYIAKSIFSSIDRKKSIKNTFGSDEKIRIQLSKDITTSERTFKDKYFPIIVLICSFVLGTIITIILTNNKLNNLALILDIVIFVCAFIVISIFRLTETYFIIREIKKYAIKKFNDDIHFEKKPNIELIKSATSYKNQERKRYLLSFYVSKYDCYIKNYYIEVLVNINNTNQMDFVEQKNLFEYSYDLSKYNIDNLNNLLENENIKKEIEILKNEKFIDISLDDNFFKITKETVFHGYSKKDAYNDINDIDRFYEELVKRILEIKNI